MVFAAPLLILLVAAAASWPHERFGPRVGSALTAALGLLAVVAALRGDVASVRSPYLGEDARTLIDGLRKERHGVEPVYVSARGIPSWVFYTTNWEKPDRERLVFYARAASSGPCFENAPPRGRPVAHEGFDLVYPRRGRVELLGIATGRQWKWPSYASESVDPGWAANEAQRIFEAVQARAQGSPCAWLYFTRLSEGSAKPLTWRLRDDYGGARHDWVGAAGGVLYRYCFPRERLGWPPGPGSSR
jgi:hypothetical protein